jgi:predicted adenine nucleotide alpha hydrolase (AANH) superfamily ATPase
MVKRNFQRELELLIARQEEENKVPTLLLHSCCAPCSSYVLEYLSHYFRITIFYYNPNIYPEEEYQKRIIEQKKLISCLKTEYPVNFISGEYDFNRFYTYIKGNEKEPEGGKRCFKCYELRLREAAEKAKDGNFDFFATTLSISPLKDAGKINEIGEKAAAEYGVNHLPSDFKKKNGYIRSIELSKKYGLYRQDYCGCIFSKEAIKFTENRKD